VRAEEPVPDACDGDAWVPLDRASADFALRAACTAAGLDATDAALIRIGDHALYRLAERRVVVRVGRDGRRLNEAQREVAVARWLAESGVPAIRVLDVTQPIVVNGRVATLWEEANDEPRYGTPAELAVLLRQLHALTPPSSLDLLPSEPFARAVRRIEHVGGLSDEDRTFLRGRCRQLAEAFVGLSFELVPGVIHGDASVGNVIRDRSGRPMFADLDGFAFGPREWDLVLTALYFERFGWHTDEEYAAFAETYGYDVMTSPAYSVLRDTREFLMVTWLSQNADSDPNVAAELAKRIEDLRTGGSRRDWQPF
jgi:aminoglycoside phosphotransferase (APT) family kinase protein